MSLNLSGGGGGNYFGDDTSSGFGYSGQNAEGVMANTDAKAVLYVFRPYANQIGNVGMRPLQYNFDENFLNETQHITNVAKRGDSRASSLVQQFMSTNNLNDNMLPSFQPTSVFKGEMLSDKYRFILVLTEKAGGLIGHNTIAATGGNGSQVRRIYTGYFEDEPFNAGMNFGSKPTLNPHSFMIITHKTIVGMATEHGRFGARTQINTQSSEEVIHSGLTSALMANGTGGGNGVFLMTPENCINSIETTGDGFSISVPGAHADISRDTGANVLADLFERPSQNVGHILRGMLLFQDDVTHRNRLSTNRADTYFEDEFLDESFGRSKLARFVSLPRAKRLSAFDLDVDSRISPVDLDKLVAGDLDVVSFDLERPMYYETADQMEVSVTNQYSFLIASVISPLLQSAGLNAMQFEYQVARMRGEFHNDFKTYSAEPCYTLPNDDLISMAKAVESELVQGIFDTIFRSMGDFHVLVSANVTGTTTVRLNLVAQGYRNKVDFELPSCMGGLISPIVGNSVANASNSEAVETLYGIATGTYLGEKKNFNENDKDFAAYSEEFTRKTKELPWNQMMTISPQDPRFEPGELEID